MYLEKGKDGGGVGWGGVGWGGGSCFTHRNTLYSKTKKVGPTMMLNTVMCSSQNTVKFQK